ncbi:LegC family aminotransferase [Roseivirga pacifica]|uniref:LegC family aminotransferase n=1 Tax=Roseivirga pacifica TaxID=1267423 RepID=UPI003BA8DD1E
MHEPQFTGKERQYLLETVDSTFVSSVGSFVDDVETKIKMLTQTAGAVAVVNGTAALQVAMRLAGVEAGDEVITQGLSFIATANAIVYNQAEPVFIDVDLDTMGMSPESLLAFLEEFGEVRDNACYNKRTNKRIAACVPMHTFGFMCRMDKVTDICREWHIPVVEDAAEALASKYKGKSAGSFGLTSAFSFNGNKIITSGGGGAIVSQDMALAKRGKYLTTTAKKSHAWEYNHDELGYNYRMPNLNAALLCGQMECLEAKIESKKELFNRYHNHFQSDSVSLSLPPEGTEWNYWLMSVRLTDRERRDEFLEVTNACKVMTRPIWNLLFRLPMYRHCYHDAQSNAVILENTIVCIPSST